MNTRDQVVANLLETQRQEIGELRKRIEKLEALRTTSLLVTGCYQLLAVRFEAWLRTLAGARIEACTHFHILLLRGNRICRGIHRFVMTKFGTMPDLGQSPRRESLIFLATSKETSKSNLNLQYWHETC